MLSAKDAPLRTPLPAIEPNTPTGRTATGMRRGYGAAPSVVVFSVRGRDSSGQRGAQKERWLAIIAGWRLWIRL